MVAGEIPIFLHLLGLMFVWQWRSHGQSVPGAKCKRCGTEKRGQILRSHVTMNILKIEVEAQLYCINAVHCIGLWSLDILMDHL